MILKTKLKYEEIKLKIKNISKEFNLSCEIELNTFKLFNSDIEIEGFFENKSIKITNKINNKENSLYPVFKVFFLLGVLMTWVFVIVENDFFLIEKIIYSIIGLIILIFRSIFSKLLSIFIMPYSENESEKKVKKILLKIKKELK